jgi:hypothetical protein
MSVQPPLQIASVNVRRRSTVLHGLLQKSPFDIILVQEPWFGKINTARNDSDPDGTDVFGATANNMWECYLPAHNASKICKVAIYVKLTFTSRIFLRCRHDLPLSSLTSMVLDLMIGDDFLRIINIYHCVPAKGHSLHHILSYETDPTIPTLVGGDFNTHRPSWLLPGATLSPWALSLEDWFEDNELVPWNPPDVATWQGRPEQCPSVLDLILLNTPAITSERFSELSMSFSASLGSDHALLSIGWTLSTHLPPPP